MSHIINMAREACISDPALLWAIILGNLCVFAAYVWIPYSVVRVLYSTDTLPQPLLWMLSGLFVLSCGITHLVGVIIIFRPYYALESGMLIMTGMISLIAATVLHRAVPAIRVEVKEYAALRERVRTLTADLDKERSCREIAILAESTAAPAPPATEAVTPDTSPDAVVP